MLQRFFRYALLCPYFALGGAYAYTSPVGFDQLLNATLTTHPSMLGKVSAVAAAQADREGAEWQRYPSPSVQLNTDQARKTYGSRSPGLLRIEQPIWAGGRISSGIRAANEREDAAGIAVEEERLSLTLKLVSSYVEALRQKNRYQYAELSLKNHQNLLRMIRERVKHEVSSQADLRLADTRLNSAQIDLSFAAQARDSALNQLVQLSGLVVEDVADFKVSKLVLPDRLNQAMDEALVWSPTLKRLSYEEAASEADIDVKRATILPQVSLRLERYFGEYSDSRAQVVLQAQPGAGFSAVSGVDAARARRDAVQYSRSAAERDLRDRVTQDWNEWSAARLRLENAENSMFMSEEVFQSYTRQYVAGRKSWLDVMNAAREATQAAFTYVDAKSQALAAGLRLRAFTGQFAVQEKP